MLVELRSWRDRLLFTCQATVPTFIILMTTVSCSKPDMPEPRVGIFGPLFSSPVIDTADQQVVQRDKPQPKVQRVQPKTSASPKVATAHAPKATGVSRATSKKTDTPPRLNTQREQQQLFQEFMEWRKRQKKDLL